MRERRSLSERLWEPRDDRDLEVFAPSFEPGNGLLGSIREDLLKRRVEWRRSWTTILRSAPPYDAAQVRRCGYDLARFHNPKTGLDCFFPKQCHNYYCPYCPHVSHYIRTLYHARKIASLDPTDEAPTPRVVNVVFTLPPELHAWAREDPRFMPAWRKSILRTLAGAFGYKGIQGYSMERVAFKELGAILNLHAIGDEAKPWPKWAPHMDLIIPAWKRVGEKVEPLRTTWPEKFAHTNARYRDELRAQLLPIALKPQYRLDVVEFLKTDFETVWHLSRPPRTPSNPDRKSMIHDESAMHRIRYSCRPLFSMSNARLGVAEASGTQVLLYDIAKGKDMRPLTHRVPLRPAMGQLESIRQWMSGRMARSQAGILSKRSYDAAAKLAGHEPVRERPKRGLVHKATYELGDDWQYQKHGRNAPSARDEDGEDVEL